jgi:hypothetical protein
MLALLGYSLSNIAFADTPAIGWIEHVKISPKNIMFLAKIDTGADNSSINARNVDIYNDNDGSQRVKFSVQNKTGVDAQFDLPVLRMANIKRKGAATLKRPVVSMNLCIGHVLKTAQVNLANRNNFKYQMLIGRTYLKNVYLVDPNKKNTVEPVCTGDALAMSN